MPCEDIQAKLSQVLSEIADAQAELGNDGTGRPATGVMKAAIVRGIASLRRQQQALGAQLEHCLISSGHPTARPLATTFCGMATLVTSDQRAAGPFVENICLGVYFNASRSEIHIISFPSISTDPFPVQAPWPIGTLYNVTTISKIGGGNGIFDKAQGAAAVNLQLRFDQSIDIPFKDEDSDTTSFVLTTGSIGGISGPLFGNTLDRTTRRMILVGSFEFVGGILDRKTGNLIIEGTFADLP